jgi:septum site-determining protein MinC
VSIKGRSEGITIEIGKGVWADVVEELRERLAQSGTFFRGGNVALDVGARPLLENELKELRLVLDQCELNLALVRTTAERTFESAIALGLAARLLASGESDAEVEPAPSNQGFSHYFVYRGNLRSGQVLERREHILVIGDVNPGAEVVSEGDILIWGRMRGIAQAGAAGDRRSVVVALHLDPIQLRIAGTIAIDLSQVGRGNNRGLWKPGDKRPEVAFIANDQIVVEPWDESKPGGLAAFRR